MLCRRQLPPSVGDQSKHEHLPLPPALFESDLHFAMQVDKVVSVVSKYGSVAVEPSPPALGVAQVLPDRLQNEDGSLQADPSHGPYQPPWAAILAHEP